MPDRHDAHRDVPGWDVTAWRAWSRIRPGAGYDRTLLRRDIIAALTVTAISLPQGMAYALLAGVDPRYGLYSAIVVTAVASIFGSSSHLINGPTSAISLVVFSALSSFGPDQRPQAAEAMFLLGAMVGVLQVMVAVLRLGDLTRYISDSVILGFMAGAAVLLAIGQLSNALGLRDRGTGADHILYRLWLTVSESGPPEFRTLAVSGTTLLLAVLLRVIVRRARLPQFDLLTVLVIVSFLSYLAGWTVPGLDGKTAVGVTGAIPGSLPSLHIPTADLGLAMDLAPSSLAIAFLGLLEALAIAKSIAGQTRQKLDFNRQCLAEGLANLTGGFFQCLPGSGSLSRSAINFQAGAATRASGLLTAGFVAIAVLSFAPLARYVPKPALAALLLLTAWRLVDIKRIAYTVRASRMDSFVMIATAVSAVAIGLDQAILIGIALSILLFVPRAARLTATELIVDAYDVVRDKLPSDPRNDGFLFYDLEGELFFGAAPELTRIFEQIEQQAIDSSIHHVLLRLKRVRHPDVVSLEQFDHFLRRARLRGLRVWLAGLRPDLLEAVQRLEFTAWLPEDHLLPQGREEDSATLAAIRRIRADVSGSPAAQHDGLYYQI